MFEQYVNTDIQEGSTIDLFLYAVAKQHTEAMQTIEDNRNPHILTRLRGDDLDDFCAGVNLFRQANEDDETLLYRLLKWSVSSECANQTSIETSLYNLEHASSAKYLPKTFGAGTASIYIIPKDYDDKEEIKLGIEEVKTRLSNKMSKSTYVQYIIPDPIIVNVTVYLESSKNLSFIQERIEDAMRLYINGIAPNATLEVNRLSKIGQDDPDVDYFMVRNVMVDGKQIDSLSVTQGIETKFILGNIQWLTGGAQ